MSSVSNPYQPLYIEDCTIKKYDDRSVSTRSGEINYFFNAPADGFVEIHFLIKYVAALNIVINMSAQLNKDKRLEYTDVMPQNVPHLNYFVKKISTGWIKIKKGTRVYIDAVGYDADGKKFIPSSSQIYIDAGYQFFYK